MAHLVIEIARQVIERQLLRMPIEFDANGMPADILAPPVPIRRSIFTPLSALRVQFIIRTVELKPVVGSSQSSLALIFDEGSIEALSFGQATVGLLGGNISIPFALMFRAEALDPARQVARLSIDFTGTNVDFNFNDESRARLVNVVGTALADMIKKGIEDSLNAQFQGLGVQPTGQEFLFTPGVPSENMLTVDELPGVVWVEPETLALSLRYAPQTIPPPFQPVPFLPPGNASAFGMWLSNDGFQRTIGTAAIRRVARDMLSARLIDNYIQQAYAKRGGTGGITEQDRTDGNNLLNEYLETTKGLNDLANETPSPIGHGMLRKRVSPVPDPFSDFDAEIPELELWLGQDRIEGRAVARGEVNGFGFNANIRFRARPVLVQEPIVSIEMHDVEIDDPDLSISLPWWLEWSVGILAGRIAGPLIGVVVGFLLSSILSSLGEALIPSNLEDKVEPLEPEPVPNLPPGATLTQLSAIPDHIAMLGSWHIYLDDPRPFYPRVRIVDNVERAVAGEPRENTAWFSCLGVLGIAADASPETGNAFQYTYQSWRSRVTVAIDSFAVPLPFTPFPWTISIGYRSTEKYQFPIIPSTVQPLVAGPLVVTADVWHPEPPLKGSVMTQQFTINVQRETENQFTLEVPPEAGCILISVETKVIDANGVTWELSHMFDVPNETVTFGDDFHRFIQECESGRRVWQLVKEPSLLERLWNPPNVYARAAQAAIRTEQPAVTLEIGSILEAYGHEEAYNLLLAPSLIRRR